MKKLLIILLVLGCSLVKGQSQLCVKLYCNDSVWLPLNAMSLVAYVTSSDPVTKRGWTQLNGPSKITVGAGDSVAISGLVAGTYLFQYVVQNSKGLSQTGLDMVTVIPVLIPARKAKVITYDDGSTQTIP